MRQQVADAYGCGVILFAVPTLKVGQIHLDSIRSAQQSPFNEEHGSHRCSHWFGTRRQVKNRVRGHGFHRRNELTVAVGFEIGHFAMSNHR